MADIMFTIHAAFDEEAGVWFVESSDLYGLNLEGVTFDELVAKLPGAIADLTDEKEVAAGQDVPVEIIAHRRSTVRVRRAA